MKLREVGMLSVSAGTGPEEATTLMGGLESLRYEDRWREFELFSLRERRPQKDILVSFLSLKGVYRKDEGDFLNEASCDSIRGDVLKVKEGD